MLRLRECNQLISLPDDFDPVVGHVFCLPAALQLGSGYFALYAFKGRFHYICWIHENDSAAFLKRTRQNLLDNPQLREEMQEFPVWGEYNPQMIGLGYN